MPDNLTPEQRSYCMSRVKNRDTNLEVLVRSALRQAGRRFTTNDRQLPGSPDVVFRRDRVAVFIHGDFWHGWRFPAWRHAVSPFWQEKIQKNRDRDRRNVTRL
jgi:DNA mismatch endonuclease (patch repair protein)